MLDAPKALLQNAGFSVTQPRDSHLCCGSAGIYNVLQPELASQLQTRKIDTIDEAGADIVVAGNLGCINQLAGVNAPILHTVQLLDWAYGGKQPEQLAALSPNQA